MFIGEKDGDTLIIRNDNKRTLTYFRTDINKPRNLAKVLQWNKIHHDFNVSMRLIA